ncbi:hypothetical protein BKD03_02645 [Brucella sp. 09RB8471]|nr:hypothetical protein BKD03_02645 [Brucella sp. 09RB8471]
MVGHSDRSTVQRGVACEQKGCAEPMFHSTSIEVQASLKAMKQRVVTVMDCVSYCDHKGRVPMVEIRKEMLGHIIECVKGLKHHFKRAIDIVNRFFWVDLE